MPRNLSRRMVLVLSILIVVAGFLVTRLPYFLYYQVPSLQPDYSSYWAPLFELEKGKLPNFSYRTPGYPVFMWLVVSVSNKLSSIVLAQNLLTLFSALLLVFSVYRAYFALTPLAAIAITAHMTSSSQILSDIALLTESVFTSFLVASFALLIWGLKEKRLPALILSSLCMALSIYVRPTGQFFVVIWGMVLLFMLYNRFGKARIAGFLLPFLVLMLLLPTYHYVSYGRFNITNGKELTLICGTSFYLKENGAYSEELNQAIRKVRDRYSEEDRKIVTETWNLSRFIGSYYKNEYWVIDQILTPFKGVPEEKRIGLPGVYSMVAMDSIRRNPGLFLKIFLMNLRLYFFRDITLAYDIYAGQLGNEYNQLVLRRDYGTWAKSEDEKRSLLREYYDPVENPYFVKKDKEGGYVVELKPTKLRVIHEAYNKVQYKIFRKAAWPVILFVIFLVSSVVFIARRGRDANSFLLIIITSSAIGHGIICSIFANTPRFSAPTEFLYYLSAALLPILLIKNKKERIPYA